MARGHWYSSYQCRHVLLLVGLGILAVLIFIALILYSISHDVDKIWLATTDTRSGDKAVEWLQTISHTVDAIQSRHSGDELLNELKAIRTALQRVESQIEEAIERPDRGPQDRS